MNQEPKYEKQNVFRRLIIAVLSGKKPRNGSHVHKQEEGYI